MKTKQLIGTVMGAALLSGAAWAQADAPEGRGPRGEERGFRPGGERREMPRGEMRGPMMRERGEMPRGEMGGPMMRERGGECGEPRGGRGPGAGAGQHGILNPERLKAAGATDEQLATIKALADEQQMKRIDLQAGVDKAELALNQLLRAEKADVDAALKAVDALSLARAALSKLEIGTQLKIRETLGPDVQKKLRDLRPPEGLGRPMGECPGAGPRPEGQPPAPQDRPQARE